MLSCSSQLDEDWTELKKKRPIAKTPMSHPAGQPQETKNTCVDVQWVNTKTWSVGFLLSWLKTLNVRTSAEQLRQHWSELQMYVTRHRNCCSSNSTDTRLAHVKVDKWYKKINSCLKDIWVTCYGPIQWEHRVLLALTVCNNHILNMCLVLFFFFGQWKMFEPESGSEKEEAPDVGRAKNGPRSVIPNLFWLVTLCWRHKFLATPDTFFFFQSRDCSQSGCISSDFVICCILLELEVYVHERARIQLFKIVSGVINNNFNIYNI